MGVKELSEPKKPLANEPCAIRARKVLKDQQKKGVDPLCIKCEVHRYSICRATGHVLCTKRKDIGWIPVPFETQECGLYLVKAGS